MYIKPKAKANYKLIDYKKQSNNSSNSTASPVKEEY